MEQKNLMTIENEGLEKMSALLWRHEGAIGRKKLDLFLSPEKNDPENGWTTTKIIGETKGDNGVTFSRMLFLDNLGRKAGVDGLFTALLPEYDSVARMDADIFSVKCSLVKRKDREILLFQTTGPVKYILGKSGDRRANGFSENDDEEFIKLVSGGTMVEKIFIDVKTGKVGKVLSAYMDMEPEEVADGDIGGVSMEFDVRDLLKKRRVRKVERSLDGELVVKEGYLIEGREFEWESTQAV